MKLAAIDIGTNSIHMIVVETNQQRSFDILEREKEMAKLGVGVFANHRLSNQSFKIGLETIARYVQLAEKLGVDDIVTAATSAIREARNGEDFLNKVVRQTGLSPRIISGKEEARLIFLAVRNSIALENDDVLVFDIGGGSTEVVVGNRENILSGILRIADGLDKTKNQLVEQVSCQISARKLNIIVSGADDLKLEIWSARREQKVLAKALKRKIEIKEVSLSKL